MSASALKALQLRAEITSLGLDPSKPHTQMDIDEARKPKQIEQSVSQLVAEEATVALVSEPAKVEEVPHEVIETFIATLSAEPQVEEHEPAQAVVEVKPEPVQVTEVIQTTGKKNKKTKAKIELESKIEPEVDIAAVEAVEADMLVEKPQDEELVVS